MDVKKVLTNPTMYGLPASPNRCERTIWNDSASERLVGMTVYYKKKYSQYINS